MRVPRILTITVTGVFHKMWRGHNREFVFANDVEKFNYLNALLDTFNSDVRKHILFHGYCLMGDHTHEVGRVLSQKQNGFKRSLKTLGDWMRNAHSRFGFGYNRRHHRQGKVAYDRPKTTEIKNEFEVLKTMFYSDANPVKSGIVAHPSNYKHSSYRFYAYGEKNRYTRYLTPPEGYLAMGTTAPERRKKYRQLCDLYLRKQGLICDRPEEDADSTETVEDFERVLFALNIEGVSLRS